MTGLSILNKLLLALLALTVYSSGSIAFGKATQVDINTARDLMRKYDDQFNVFIVNKIKAGKDLSTWYELLALSGTRMGGISISDPFFQSARSAARLEPKDPHILTTYAMVLAIMNQKDEGQKIISLVLAKNPKDARAHAVLALLLAISGENEDFVREEIELAIELNPNDPDVNNMAFRCYKRLLDYKNTKAALDRWVNCKPVDLHALRNRADFARETKHFQESVNDIQAAIKINPKLEDNFGSLVLTYMDWKKYKEAIEASKYLDRKPLQSKHLYAYDVQPKS